jgi:hypothetical protein
MHYFFLSSCLVSSSLTSYCEVLGSNLRLLIAYHDRFSSGVLTVSRKIVGSKAVPLKAWSGPEGSRKLSFPDFVTTVQDGGKVVSLTHRPHLPQEILLVLISVRGWIDPRENCAILSKLSHDSFVTRASQISIYLLSWSLTTVLSWSLTTVLSWSLTTVLFRSLTTVLSELSTQPLNKQIIKRTTSKFLFFICFLSVLLSNFMPFPYFFLCSSLFLPTLMSSLIFLFYFFLFFLSLFSIFIVYIFLPFFYVSLFSFCQLKISVCPNLT